MEPADTVQAPHKQPLSSTEELALRITSGVCVKVWLQEFAWTEEDKEEDMKSRSASTGKLSAKDASSLQKQPMFCMETAVNMFYWSVLVYDHEEVMQAHRLMTKPHALIVEMEYLYGMRVPQLTLPLQDQDRCALHIREHSCNAMKQGHAGPGLTSLAGLDCLL